MRVAVIFAPVAHFLLAVDKVIACAWKVAQIEDFAQNLVVWRKSSIFAA